MPLVISSFAFAGELRKLGVETLAVPASVIDAAAVDALRFERQLVWMDAVADKKKEMNELFRSGKRLRFVAWRTSAGAYWISNTLTMKLRDDQGAANAEMWVRDWIETWGLRVHVLDRTMSLAAITPSSGLVASDSASCRFSASSECI